MLESDYDYEDYCHAGCNFLFRKPIKEKFKPYVRCELCKYAEFQEGLPKGYIHCLKYPRMISQLDQTCKSGTFKDEGKNEN